MQIESKYLNYSVGAITFEAYCAYQPSRQKQPDVLVAPAWAGRGDFVCQKAKMLAKMGYVGIAIDVYGESKVGHSKEQNSAMMLPLLNDREILRDRLASAFAATCELPEVDVTRIAAMGYCFGGLCVLDMARHNFALKSVISFHGWLSDCHVSKPSAISSSILVLHGHEDPMVTPEDVIHFEKEMSRRQADWQMHIFGNTMHAFTNPKANDKDFGTVYHPISDNRSWKYAIDFLAETLKR